MKLPAGAVQLSSAQSRRYVGYIWLPHPADTYFP